MLLLPLVLRLRLPCMTAGHGHSLAAVEGHRLLHNARWHAMTMAVAVGAWGQGHGGGELLLLLLLLLVVKLVGPTMGRLGLGIANGGVRA